MLSFDISDTKIRVVKGDVSGVKVKINGAMSINVPDGVIVNGFVQELSKAVTVISDRLRDNRFSDKEAVVTLSSSQIVFREFNIPKGKGNALYSMIKNQIQNDMGLSENYNITYTVVGETKDNGGIYKVLAAACPNDIVVGISRLFNMLSLQVRSISINCNSISKIVLADPRTRDRMPLLAIQVDSDFLNLNLYENNQLAFSRVVPISKEDYDSDDYVYQALNENVFRMIQFNRARGSSAGIKDVIFYGDVSDYIKLTRSIEQQDVRTHILPVPQTISGYERFEFALYANAIGAMMKGRKELEKTNLLEVESTVSKNKEVEGGLVKPIVTAAVVAALIGGGIFGYFKFDQIMKEKDRDKIVNYNNSPEVQKKLGELKNYQAKLSEINQYVKDITDNYSALTSNKIMNKELMDKIRECMASDNGTPVELGRIINVDYETGILKLSVKSANKNYPAKIVNNIMNLATDKIVGVGYHGLSSKEEGTTTVYTFEMELVLKEGKQDESNE